MGLFKLRFDFRDPDFVIKIKGVEYIRRWYLARHKERGINVYLHNMLQDDLDRALHDHRSHNISIVLSGMYYEHFEDGTIKVRRPFRPIFRNSRKLHRITLPKDSDGVPIPCWTLFILGPWFRNWGFITDHGWIPNEQYLAEREEL